MSIILRAHHPVARPCPKHLKAVPAAHLAEPGGQTSLQYVVKPGLKAKNDPPVQAAVWAIAALPLVGR